MSIESLWKSRSFDFNSLQCTVLTPKEHLHFWKMQMGGRSGWLSIRPKCNLMAWRKEENPCALLLFLTGACNLEESVYGKNNTWSFKERGPPPSQFSPKWSTTIDLKGKYKHTLNSELKQWDLKCLALVDYVSVKRK